MIRPDSFYTTEPSEIHHLSTTAARPAETGPLPARGRSSQPAPPPVKETGRFPMELPKSRTVSFGRRRISIAAMNMILQGFRPVSDGVSSPAGIPEESGVAFGFALGGGIGGIGGSSRIWDEIGVG